MSWFKCSWELRTMQLLTDSSLHPLVGWGGELKVQLMG